MRKFFIFLPLVLTACVTDRQLSNYICDHQLTVAVATRAAIAKAQEIKDPVVKQATLDSLQVTLDTLAACPKEL